MSKTKRNRYSAEFKAIVALEAIKGDQTINELGSRYGLHPNKIANWKRQAIENMPKPFPARPSPLERPTRPRSRNCTPRSGSSPWNGIF